MELNEEFLQAYALVAADKQAKAALNRAKGIVQAALDAGILNIHDPARVTHYNEKHYGLHSVSISHGHYELIKDDLSEELKQSVEKAAARYSDGPAFPSKHRAAIVAALEAKGLAWKACYVQKKLWD